jgi:hypothetical protein
MGTVVRNFLQELEAQMGAKALILVGWKDGKGDIQTTK